MDLLLLSGETDSLIARAVCRRAAARGHRVRLAVRRLAPPPEGAASVHRLGLSPGWLWGWLDFPLAAARLVGIGRRFRVRVIYAAALPHDYLPLLLAKTVLGVPVVGSFHRRPRDPAYGPLAGRLFGGLFDRLAVPSERMRGELALVLPASAPRLRVVHNAAPPLSRPYVLTLSRVCYDKGIDILLFAFHDFLRRGGGWDLAVCGDDPAPGKPFLRRCRALARSLGLEGRVHFWGGLDRARAHQLLRGCEAFVLASRWEGQSMALLEALAAGKPAAATDVGGARETFRDGEEGLLVPPLDPAALAAALERLEKDASLRGRLAAAAPAAAARFSWDRFGDESLNLAAELAREE